MPATDEMIERAIECLERTTVNSFTASPPTVSPGQASTLKWKVTTAAGCAPQLLLNNSAVQKTGSRSIQPVTTTTFLLVGRIGTVQRTLGTATVNVNTSQCITRSVEEETVRQMLRGLIEANLAGTPLSQRSPASVEIDRNGIAVKLRMRIAVPSFFDPNLNVDMLIAVRAVDGESAVSYRSFSVDVDWPWWVTGITLGVTEFIEGVIENRIERRLKPLILQKLKEQIDSFLRLIPSTHRLTTLTTEADQITGMACPRPLKDAVGVSTENTAPATVK